MMKLRFAHYGFTIWLLLLVSCQERNNLESYMDSLPASLVVSFHIQDKKGNVLAGQNADKQIPSASIIKIPILIELMNQVDAGALRLDQEVVMRKEDIVSGAGELQFQPDGTSYPLRYLAREMIRISDNVATNLLIEQVEMVSIQSWLAANGYKLTQLSRKMMDFEAITEGRQNYTSPKEISNMLVSLYSGKYLSKESTAFIMDLLLDCADSSTIPSKLPAMVKVAHKTGTLAYVRGDAGIILGGKPMILAVFVEGFESLDQAEEVIGEISKIAWEIF